MLKIYLYKFTKKTNSTARPGTPYLTLDCAIKTPSSILRPYIDIATESDLSAVNYAYIPDYDRYYFINDIVYNRGLWELSMQVDVLASYRNTIGNTELYILRSSHTWNSYYSDRDYPANGNVTPVEITIDNSGGNLTYSTGYYIVTTVSKSVGRTTYQLTGSQFKTIMQQAMGNYGTGFGSLVQGIQNALYNPLDYIVSCFWVPVGFVTDGTARVAFGPWEPTDENGGVITAPIVKDGYSAISYGVNIPKHPQSASYGKYVSMAPFAEYVLDMGFCEPIKLDTTMLVDADRLQITIYPDALTGQALMYAWTLKGSGRQLLFKMMVNYGVPVNMSTVKNNALGVLGGIATTAISAATGNAVGAWSGAAATVGSIIESSDGTVYNTGGVGTIGGHIVPKKLYARFYEVADMDLANNGRPLYQKRRPSAIPGYMQVMNGRIEVEATAAEKDQIAAYLEGGFYYA